MTSATWRTSRYRGDNGGACGQVMTAVQDIAVRDSKDPAARR